MPTRKHTHTFCCPSSYSRATLQHHLSDVDSCTKSPPACKTMHFPKRVKSTCTHLSMTILQDVEGTDSFSQLLSCFRDDESSLKTSRLNQPTSRKLILFRFDGIKDFAAPISRTSQIIPRRLLQLIVSAQPIEYSPLFAMALDIIKVFRGQYWYENYSGANNRFND